MSTGAMKGEAQLVNLMHCRYVEALRDFVTMVGGSNEQVKSNIILANKLSTMNVNKYGITWGVTPKPQMVVHLSTDNNIISTAKDMLDE